MSKTEEGENTAGVTVGVVPNYRFLPKEWLIALLWGSEDARSRYLGESLTEQT